MENLGTVNYYFSGFFREKLEADNIPSEMGSSRPEREQSSFSVYPCYPCMGPMDYKGQ